MPRTSGRSLLNRDECGKIRGTISGFDRTILSTLPLPFGLRLIRQLDFPRKLGFCERLFAERLAKHKITWVSTAAAIPWKLDLRNATHRWIVYGKYEGAPFLNWARRFLTPYGIIVDSGANIGQMLLYLAQWVPQGRVLAIEPGKHSADWLQECLEANSQLPVELLRVALGSTRHQAHLKEIGGTDRHGSWNQVSNLEGESISVVPLTELLRERDVEYVDPWKLDVEGSEIPALEGAEWYLSEQRIRSLYVELRGDNGRAICDFLGRFAYDCRLFNRTGSLYSPDDLPEESNGLFMRRANTHVSQGYSS